MSIQIYCNYITGLVSGPGIKERFPVKTVATSNINIATSIIAVTVNGYTMALGDRILLSAQTSGAQNGIYIAITGSLIRSEDYESGDLSQSFVSITAGTYINTIWQALGNGIVGTGSQGFAMINNNVHTPGAIQYASSSTILAKLSAPGTTSILQMTGAGVPSWINNLPVSLGGTGSSSLASGNILLGAGTSAITTLAPLSYKVLVTDNTPAYILSNIVHLSNIQGAATTNNILSFTDIASAVNSMTFSNAITSNSPIIAVSGSDANISLAYQAKGTGTYRFLSSTVSPAQLSLSATNSSNFIAIKAPTTVASSIAFTLPAIDGTNGQVLSTNGAGILSFISASGGGVTSFAGRTGIVSPAEGDYTLTQLGDVTLSSPSSGQVLSYNGSNWANTSPTSTTYITFNSWGNLSQSNYFRAGGGLAGSTYAQAAIIMPRACTVTTMTMGLSLNSSPGSWIANLYKNGVSTGSNVTVANSTRNTNTVNISYAQYDTLAVFITNANNPVFSTGYVTLEIRI